MSVQFEEPQYSAPVSSQTREKGLRALVKKSGLAKTDQEAERVLLGALIVFILITIGALFMAFPSSEEVEMPFEPAVF